EPGQVAAHLLATEPAGDSGAVKMLAAAARDAVSRGAADAAATYLRRALDEPAPKTLTPELLWQLGRAEAALAGPGALPTLERARVRDPRLLASLAVAAVGRNQPLEVAVELAERALEGMPAGDMDPEAVIYIADVFAYCDRFEAARRVADELAAQGSARGSAI